CRAELQALARRRAHGFRGLRLSVARSLQRTSAPQPEAPPSREERTVGMRKLSSLFAFVALLAVGPLPARACTTDTECDDGNVCDGAEYCQAGVCYSRTPLVCDDGDPCTVNTCDPNLGCQFQPSAGSMTRGHNVQPGSPSD